MNFDDYLKYAAQDRGSNPFMYRPDQMASQLGFKGNARTFLGMGGSPSESTGEGTEAMYGLSPEFETFLRQYDYTPGMQGKNADVDIRDAAGNTLAQDFRTGDHTGSMMKFMSKAMPALVLGGLGVGAYGALGLGGGGAAAGAGEAAAAGAGDAWGATIGNSLADFSLANTGAAAAEGSAPLFGAGADAAAGYIVPSAGQFAGMSVPQLDAARIALNAVGGVAGGAAAGAAGGIPWGKVGAAAVAPALSAGAQIYGANQAAGAMRDATNQANQLNAPAVAVRNSALEQMQALLKDPSTLTSQPGYAFGMDQGTKALNSGAAARGMSQSGAADKARIRYGQDYAGTKLDQSFNRLATLASGGQQGTSETVNNTTNQGNANAMPWVVGANAVADGINGLTAYGQRKQWWGP